MSSKYANTNGSSSGPMTVHIDRIESVQKQFLLFALRGLNWDQNVRLPSYSSRLLIINLPTLVSRRIMLGTIFMNNLSSRERWVLGQLA